MSPRVLLGDCPQWPGHLWVLGRAMQLGRGQAWMWPQSETSSGIPQQGVPPTFQGHTLGAPSQPWAGAALKGKVESILAGAQAQGPSRVGLELISPRLPSHHGPPVPNYAQKSLLRCG